MSLALAVWVETYACTCRTSVAEPGRLAVLVGAGRHDPFAVKSLSCRRKGCAFGSAIWPKLSLSGQAYQDPKDALNEFVSNAADEYAEAERRGERIKVVLRRKSRYPMITVDDGGRDMSPD